MNSGFGREMTEQLLAAGERVAGTVPKPGSVADLEQKYGERFWVAQLDVADLPNVRATVDRAFGELGLIDVVVNNAGYGLFGAAEELTDEQMIAQLNTNLLSSIQVAEAPFGAMRSQAVAVLGGRVSCAEDSISSATTSTQGVAAWSNLWGGSMSCPS